MKNQYINDKIYGLPKLLKKGCNTSPNKNRIDSEYVHKVEINKYFYYKVHIKRQDVSKIKYFTKLKQAKLFVAMLRSNKYF